MAFAHRRDQGHAHRHMKRGFANAALNGAISVKTGQQTIDDIFISLLEAISCIILNTNIIQTGHDIPHTQTKNSRIGGDPPGKLARLSVASAIGRSSNETMTPLSPAAR